MTTQTKTVKKLRKNRGQGMTEYIIIVALIAIAAIGVITLFGNNIRRLFGASADALAGQTAVTPDTGQATAEHKQTKTLKTFATGNAAQ
jgi:Flp pilus assembly pilin Flp